MQDFLLELVPVYLEQQQQLSQQVLEDLDPQQGVVVCLGQPQGEQVFLVELQLVVLELELALGRSNLHQDFREHKQVPMLKVLKWFKINIMAKNRCLKITPKC